ncbi:DUF72 domain-containing protein [Curtobacterium sp. MCBD17_030]|uniref:DUF72 domain-containing protein n=1 Tax=Curtobacterium sp. MCBD17_030 TaxID=2175649 RepID=UPI0021AD0643|nr:DUF72 domain-containing protein [Curtobacterium sp. MCBD17_030]
MRTRATSPAWSTTPTRRSAYLRLHGAPHTYHDGYGREALLTWADTVRHHVTAGRDVWVYFDNDAERHAPWDALELGGLLGLPTLRR